MARLTIQQTAAPDFSASGRMLAEAGKTFDQGLQTARGVLGDYQEGVIAKNDSAFQGKLAGLKNQKQYDAFADGGGFDNLNISEGMRNQMFGTRGNLADIAGTNASTVLAGAQTGLANETAIYRGQQAENLKTENDQAVAQNVFDNASREEKNRLAPLMLAAGNEARELGVDGGRSPRELAYREGIAGIESAGSGDYAAVGLTDQKLGRALGRYQIMEANIPQWSMAALGREVSAEEFMQDPSIQDAIFDNKFGEYVKQYGEEGAAQAWFGGPGGVGEVDRTDAYGVKTIGSYGETFAKAIDGTGQSSTPAQDALQAALMNTKNLSPETLLSIQDGVYTQQNVGEGREIAAAAQTEQDVVDAIGEANAALLVKISNTDSALTSADALAISAANAPPNETAVQKLARRELVNTAFGPDGDLAGTLLGGSTGLGTGTLEAIKLAKDADTRLLEVNPSVLAYRGAELYSNSDPDQSLAEDLEMLDAQGMVPAKMREAISVLANQYGITRAEAAYAFKLGAQTEEGEGVLLPNANKWFDGLAQKSAGEAAALYFANGASALTANQISDATVRQSQIAGAQAIADNAARIFQKASAGGVEAPVERKAAEQALQDLKDIMFPPPSNPNNIELLPSAAVQANAEQLRLQEEAAAARGPTTASAVLNEATDAAKVNAPTDLPSVAPPVAVVDQAALDLADAARTTAENRLTSGSGGPPTPSARAAAFLNQANPNTQGVTNANVQGVSQNAQPVAPPQNTPGPASAEDVRQIISILTDRGVSSEEKLQAIRQYAETHGQQAVEQLMAVVGNSIN